MAEPAPQPMPGAQPGMQQPPPEQKKGGLFGKKQPEQQGGGFNEVMMEVGAVGRRLRILEERYNNLRKKSQVSDQNQLNQTKKISTQLKDVNEEILEIKRSVDDIKEKMRMIIKELKITAKKEEIGVLQKYIQFWEPVNFITRNEVERIIEDILDSKLNKESPIK